MYDFEHDVFNVVNQMYCAYRSSNPLIRGGAFYREGEIAISSGLRHLRGLCSETLCINCA